MKYRIFIALLLAGIASGARADDIKWKEQKSQHFLIYYNKADQDFIDTVTKAAEEYYTEISQSLGVRRFKSWTWEDRARIYIYDDQDAYVSEGKQIGWSHGVAYTKQKVIRTFPSANGFFDSIMPHELTHIIFHELVGYQSLIPSWFEEGIAMYHEKARSWGAHVVVRKAIKGGTFISLPELSQMRLTADTKQETVNLFYAESASAVNFLMTKQGEERFFRLCQGLTSGTSFESSFESAYVQYRTIDKLNKAWMEFLKND